MSNTRVEVILGCMFSGKSTELLRRTNRYRAIGKKVLLINHTYDSRTDESIQTHSNMKQTAIKTDTSKISTGGLGGTHIDSTPDLLDSGNAPTYANNANLANYLTTYAQITAGTTVTETAAVTAVTTNRTGW